MSVVNSIFQTYVQCYAQKEDEITEHDLTSFEDLLVVALELINEVKIFDPSVFNPINFIHL